MKYQIDKTLNVCYLLNSFVNIHLMFLFLLLLLWEVLNCKYTLAIFNLKTKQSVNGGRGVLFLPVSAIDRLTSLVTEGGHNEGHWSLSLKLDRVTVSKTVTNLTGGQTMTTGASGQ